MTNLPPAPQAILNGIKRLLSERTQWDEIPEWGLLYREGADGVRLAVVPTPPHVWTLAKDPKNVFHHTIRVLQHPRGLAEQHIADGLRAHLPDNMCGVFHRVEGWAPPEHRAEEMHRRYLDRGRAGERFADMSGRREFRMGTAVDSTGRYYLAVQERNSPEIHAEYQGMTGSRIAGGVPELLGVLVRELMKPPQTRVPGTFAPGKV